MANLNSGFGRRPWLLANVIDHYRTLRRRAPFMATRTAFRVGHETLLFPKGRVPANNLNVDVLLTSLR
jgi:hypothetical protein